MSSTLPPTFEYRPLDDPSATIRILYLLRELATLPNGQKVPLCILKDRPIAENPSYTALSYAWGDAENPRVILIDGNLKLIGRNLADFLDQAVEDLQECKTALHPYWIDALCIDQSNDKEKSQQLQSMGRIYTGATDVTVWLGPTSLEHRSDQAMRFLVETESWMEANDLIHSSASYREAGYRYFDYFFSHQKTLDPLFHLVARPWWRRVWVQQEVILAPFNESMMQCGKKRVSWQAAALSCVFLNEFVHMITTWQQTRWSFSVPQAEAVKTMLLVLVAGMCVFLKNRVFRKYGVKGGGQAYKLFGILNESTLTPMLQATLRVDYVFGVMGIATDMDEASKYFQIDYSKPVQQVFTAVARYCYACGGAEVFKYCCLHQSSKLQLPSWVPDWSSRCEIFPFETLQDTYGVHDYHPKLLYYTSGRDSKFSCHFDGERIQLLGVKVDTVSTVGVKAEASQMGNTADDKQFMHCYISKFCQWLLRYEIYLGSVLGDRRLALEDAVCRIPIADQWHYHEENITIRAPAHIRNAFFEVLEYAHMQGNDQDGFEISEDAQAYLETASANTANRIPFVSTSGLVGLGPNTMQPGDKIFVVTGADVPLVLRDARDGHYRIVGQAYLYGIMDGEVMEQHPNVETLTII